MKKKIKLLLLVNLLASTSVFAMTSDSSTLSELGGQIEGIPSADQGPDSSAEVAITGDDLKVALEQSGHSVEKRLNQLETWLPEKFRSSQERSEELEALTYLLSYAHFEDDLENQDALILLRAKGELVRRSQQGAETVEDASSYRSIRDLVEHTFQVCAICLEYLGSDGYMVCKDPRHRVHPQCGGERLKRCPHCRNAGPGFFAHDTKLPRRTYVGRRDSSSVSLPPNRDISAKSSATNPFVMAKSPRPPRRFVGRRDSSSISLPSNRDISAMSSATNPSVMAPSPVLQTEFPLVSNLGRVRGLPMAMMSDSRVSSQPDREDSSLMDYINKVTVDKEIQILFDSSWAMDLPPPVLQTEFPLVSNLGRVRGLPMAMMSDSKVSSQPDREDSSLMDYINKVTVDKEKSIYTLQILFDSSGSMRSPLDSKDFGSKTLSCKQVGIELVKGFVEQGDFEPPMFLTVTGFSCQAKVVMSSGLYPVFRNSNGEILSKVDGTPYRANVDDKWDEAQKTFKLRVGEEEYQTSRSVCLLLNELQGCQRRVGKMGPIVDDGKAFPGFSSLLSERMNKMPSMGISTNAYIGCAVANHEVARFGILMPVMDASSGEVEMYSYSAIPVILVDGPFNNLFLDKAFDDEAFHDKYARQLAYSAQVDQHTSIINHGLVVLISDGRWNIDLKEFPAIEMTQLSSVDEISKVIDWLKEKVNFLKTKDQVIKLTNAHPEKWIRIELTAEGRPTQSVILRPNNTVYTEYWSGHSIKTFEFFNRMTEDQIASIRNELSKAMTKGIENRRMGRGESSSR